jgi:hypothetical protein
MAGKLVIGLFESKGEAENVRHRLEKEGVASGDISERVLRDTAPPPTTMEPELAPFGADPFVGFFGGDLHERYAEYIRNGETLLMVKAPSDAQAEAVASILALYEPLRVDVQAEGSTV